MNVLSQIVSAVYAHDHPLARKLFRQLLGGHLHGVGAMVTATSAAPFSGVD